MKEKEIFSSLVLPKLNIVRIVRPFKNSTARKFNEKFQIKPFQLNLEPSSWDFIQVVFGGGNIILLLAMLDNSFMTFISAQDEGQDSVNSWFQRGEKTHWWWRKGTN